MKSISHRLRLLFLIVVLGISPISASYATVASCSDMMTEIDHAIMSNDINKTNSEPDCCNQKSCAAMQCTNTVTIGLLSTGISFNKSNINYLNQSLNQSINAYYHFSIYRPPKV